MVIPHNAFFPKRCKCFVNVVSINTIVELRQFLILINSGFSRIECMAMAVTCSFLTWRSQ